MDVGPTVTKGAVSVTEPPAEVGGLIVRRMTPVPIAEAQRPAREGLAKFEKQMQQEQ